MTGPPPLLVESPKSPAGGERRPPEPAAIVRVTVHKVAGDSVELEVEAESTVAHLKSRVAETWSVPAPCQRLIVGLRVPEDSESLADVCAEQGSPALCVTMVITLDEVLCSLEPGRAGEQREAALQVLAALGPQGGEAASAAVWSSLSDLHSGVRRAAAQTLARTASRGDPAAVAELTRLLADSVMDVRCAALKALAEVAPAGDPEAVRTLAKSVSDPEAGVRRAALEALQRVAADGREGDEGEVEGGGPGSGALSAACSAACSALEDRHPAVRSAAVPALVMLAQAAGPAGREEGVSLLLPLLQSPGFAVRRAALQALGQLAEQGDERVICAACDCCGDSHAGVRQAANAALARATLAGIRVTTAEAATSLAGARAAAEGADPGAGDRFEVLKARYYKTIMEISATVTSAQAQEQE